MYRDNQKSGGSVITERFYIDIGGNASGATTDMCFRAGIRLAAQPMATSRGVIVWLLGYVWHERLKKFTAASCAGSGGCLIKYQEPDGVAMLR